MAFDSSRKSLLTGSNRAGDKVSEVGLVVMAIGCFIWIFCFLLIGPEPIWLLLLFGVPMFAGIGTVFTGMHMEMDETDRRLGIGRFASQPPPPPRRLPPQTATRVSSSAWTGRDSDGSPKGGDGEAGSVHDSAAIAPTHPRTPRRAGE